MSYYIRHDDPNFVYRVNWYYISNIQDLSEEFLREFADRLNWELVLLNNKVMSEGFIREIIASKYYSRIHPDCLYSIWTTFSLRRDLSEDFIRGFSDKINWNWIGNPQVLSEGFIREFAHRLNWYVISHYQPLSEDFVREFIDRIHFRSLLKNENVELTEAFYEEFKDKINAS